jgi:hypothetical protein
MRLRCTWVKIQDEVHFSILTHYLCKLPSQLTPRVILNLGPVTQPPKISRVCVIYIFRFAEAEGLSSVLNLLQPASTQETDFFLSKCPSSVAQSAQLQAILSHSLQNMFKMTTLFRGIGWWEEDLEAWKKACDQGLPQMAPTRWVLWRSGDLSN